MRVLAATMLSLTLAVAGLVQDRPVGLGSIVPRKENASKQLAHARRVKNERIGKPPDERLFWTLRAVDAYRAVRAHHPSASAAGAEAAFRAGELLSAIDRPEEALDEFRVAERLGAGTSFRARAVLEIGHVRRRSGRTEEALAAYLEVAGDPRASASHRDDAWSWVARMWGDLGRTGDARRAWRNVAERAIDPVDRLKAFDSLGMSWLAAGDPEAAAGVLNECLRALSEVALERTRTGERVRRAMQRMRLVDALPKAIERRLRSRSAKGSPRKP